MKPRQVLRISELAIEESIGCFYKTNWADLLFLVKKGGFMQTLIEALQQAKQEGYREDYNLKFLRKDVSKDRMEEKILDFCAHHRIDKVFRVDEQTDPADQCVVYAISSEHGEKGILLNGYGPYSDSLVNQVTEHLDSKRHQMQEAARSNGLVSDETWVF